MASFLQKSNPWIENTFTFAISFNPDTEEGFGNNRTPNKNNNNKEDDDIFNSQYYNQEESSQYIQQTEDTIPEGLVGTPEKQNTTTTGYVGGREEDELLLGGITKDVIEAPSRQTKIAQVISRGGNFNYYNTTATTTATSNTNNSEGLNKKKASSNKEENNCPPYLIIHDGEYSTIAFLSPEVCAGYNNNGNSNDIPPNKSLISITHYTVSTIYQCCTSSSSSTTTTNNNNNNMTHLQIIKNLTTTNSIPQPYTQQIHNQIPNSKLYTCLYIQSSIIVIGAENQGLINNPIDVHCSVLLRRCLIAHEAQNGGSEDRGDRQEGNENEEREEREEYSHNVLITRLEAVHLHYQDLAEKKFHDEQHELNRLQLHHPVQQQQEQQELGGGLTVPDSPSSPTTSSLASSPATSPHNNNHTKKNKKKQYGRRRNNNKKQQQQVGKKDSPYKSVGVSVVIPPEWPWVSRLVEQGGGVGNCLIKEEPIDEKEMQRMMNMNMNSSSNGQQEQEGQQVNGGLEGVPEEDKEENDKVIEEGDDNDHNMKETDAAAAVLPLEKEDQESSSNKPAAAAATTRTTARRSIGNVVELFDNFDDLEEVLGLTELDDDDNAAATAIDGTNLKTADKKASIGMPKDDNEGDETTTSPSRGNNTVSFVGIDDMLVDDDDDESEDDDNDNQLFTQPPDYGEGGGGFSQIPMALKRGSPKARFKANQNDEQFIVESQVPLPLTRQAASEKSPRRQHSLDEEDEDVDFDPQSQIPLPIRRASKKSMSSEPNDDGEDDGAYEYQESQIPLPTKKKKKKKKKESPLPTKKSKRWRKNMQEEEIVPRSLRKQPPETLGMNVSGDGVDRRQTQIPLPTRKRVSNERQVAAEEEDDRRQSQIPLPTRKKKKMTHGHGKGQQTANRFSLQSNHYKSSRQHPKYSESEEEEDDDDGRIEMSQVPINTRKQSIGRKSPLKPKPKVDDSSDASSDEWMQIRRTAKPKNTVVKSKKSRSSLQSNHFGRKFDDSLERAGKMKSNSSRSKAQPPAKRTKYEDSNDDSDDQQSQSQMAAGEGSEESIPPPRKRLRDEEEESDSKNDPTVRNSTVASKAKAILGTSPVSSVARAKQSNDDGLSLEGFKIVKNKKRKGNFDMSSFLENTKKFAWL